MIEDKPMNTPIDRVKLASSWGSSERPTRWMDLSEAQGHYSRMKSAKYKPANKKDESVENDT